MLIANLVMLLSDRGERLSLAKRLIETAEPVTFAAECIRWLRVEHEKPDPEDFTEAEEGELYEAYACRIRQYVEAHDPFEELGAAGTAGVLATWRRSRGRQEVTEYLDALFSDTPEYAVVLLKGLRPTTTGMDSGISRPGDFGKGQYDNLSFIADPEMVQQHLLRHFDDGLDMPDQYPRSDDTESDVVVAQQFLWVHEHQRSNNTIDSPTTEDCPADE